MFEAEEANSLSLMEVCQDRICFIVRARLDLHGGRSMPKISSTAVQSKTEYAGRRAGVG